MADIRSLISIMTENLMRDQANQAGSSSSTNDTAPGMNYELMAYFFNNQEKITKLESELNHAAEAVKQVNTINERMAEIKIKIDHIERDIQEIKDDRKFNITKWLSIIAIVTSFAVAILDFVVKKNESPEPITQVQSSQDTKR